MSKVVIDGQEYALDQLSDAAKQQIASIQFVDGKIRNLQAELAVMQTARMAYVNALKELLSDASPESENG